jgi:hypothetical protein|tara:strand:+ start:328 stop:492 length:165 start_codon:yes stop_codon:yes gene_type:complete
MAKGKSMVHKLDKETQRRHFSDVNGGKGDRNRTSSTETRKAFKTNYDAIDWSKK